MAIFNAWCDRMPVLVLGATGPVDAAKRRPWIDWIHTARDQGALVRPYTKWDDQPASPRRRARGAAARHVDRRHRAAGAGLCESRRRDAGGEARRAAAAGRCRALHAAGRERARPRSRSRRPRRCCKAAKSIVILIGRASRSERRWNARVAARRSDRRARHHRPEGRRELPDRSSAASRRAVGAHARCRRTGGARQGRRDPQPRLGRSRRHAEGREGAGRERQGHQRLDRLSDPQRLEHGPSGSRAGRSACSPPIPSTPCRCCSTRSARRASAPRAARPDKKRNSPAGPLTVEHLARALRDAVGDTPLLAHPSAALLERRVVAVPPSARLPRLRRRRRARRRSRRHGRRGAGAQRIRPHRRSASAATAIS